MSRALTLTVIFLAACVTCSYAQWPRHPMSPVDEANYIALGSDEEALLPNPDLVEKISKTIVKIRKKFPEVVKIRNQGNWFLGRVLVPDFNDATHKKMDKGKFGPVTGFLMADLVKSNAAEVTLKNPYHPERLCKALKEEFGIEAQAIWHDKNVPDLGGIRYDMNTNEYSFSDSLFNCDPDCSWMSTWNFKVDPSSDEITLDSSSAVDVPKNRDY